ncbi:MAG: hypothetical protein RL112_48 [Planctomycetota bacterium]
MDAVLADARCAGVVELVGRELAAAFAARLFERWRAAIKDGELDAARLAALLEAGEPWRSLEHEARRERRKGLVRCVNATGVVLNTGLGRAPVHPEVAEAMAEAARSYCVLEVDRSTNERNQRDDRLSELLARLTGAEAGIGVNNCAAAVYLAFQTFAGGREAIVSRGELVEIGGSFRVPDVMARAGAKLVEVGTTNRTRIADYERAVGPATGLLVKVHSSNFKMVGFVEETPAAELARLGRERGVATAFDLGSGLFDFDDEVELAPLLGDEPMVRDAVASGVDLVMYSGDKLFGGPQAGLVVGRRDKIRELRKNPLYRALRLDKVAIAGLEATLRLLSSGRAGELPARAMLSARAADLLPRAEALAARLVALGFDARVVPGQSQPGSGAAPGVLLDTHVVRLAPRGSAAALARALRECDPPVFARVADEALLLDPRTLLPGDDELLLAACAKVAHGCE